MSFKMKWAMATVLPCIMIIHNDTFLTEKGFFLFCNTECDHFVNRRTLQTQSNRSMLLHVQDGMYGCKSSHPLSHDLHNQSKATIIIKVQ